MQNDELAGYLVPASGKEVRTRCIERHHLLIRDVYVSDAALKSAWP